MRCIDYLAQRGSLCAEKTTPRGLVDKPIFTIYFFDMCVVNVGIFQVLSLIYGGVFSWTNLFLWTFLVFFNLCFMVLTERADSTLSAFFEGRATGCRLPGHDVESFFP